MGEGEQAVEKTERALTLSPLDPLRYYFNSLSATAALAAHHYERAIELAQASLKLNCTHTSTLRALAIAQVGTGDLSAARFTVKRLLELEPGLTAKKYLARSPGANFGTGLDWSRALVAAGLPE